MLFILMLALLCPIPAVAGNGTAPPERRPAQPARRLLRIDQGRQMMHVYENNVRVRSIPVSTGMPTSNTLTRSWRGTVGRDLGAIPVQGGLYVDYAWYLYPDLYGNILIHSVPYTRQNGLKAYDQPGALGQRPSSHGCIRISPRDAAWLQEWDPAGARIQISAWPGPVRAARPAE